MEALRYLPFLSSTGYIVSNTAPFINIPSYPELELILAKLKENERLVAIDAEKIAEELGAKLSSNMVMLGAAAPFLNHIAFEALEKGVRELFARKGEDVINTNLKALIAGKTFAESVLK